MFKAAIFDMDGLMIDTENVTYQCYKDVLKTMNLEMTKAFYTTLLGRTMEATRRAMFDQYGEDFPIEEVAKKVHQLICKRRCSIKRWSCEIVDLFKGTSL